MNLFGNLLQWALKAAASDQGKQLALRAVGEGADALLKAVTTHAPDMAPQAKSAIEAAVSASVAGIMTRVR